MIEFDYQYNYIDEDGTKYILGFWFGTMQVEIGRYDKHNECMRCVIFRIDGDKINWKAFKSNSAVRYLELSDKAVIEIEDLVRRIVKVRAFI